MNKEKVSNLIDWLLVSIMCICMFIVFILWCNKAQAQSVVRQGNVFVQDTSSHKIAKDNPTLTKYFYVASDGTKYPIYMSANGKCFIVRTSKNGKQYKQYLPEVTKQLQNENRQK